MSYLAFFIVESFNFWIKLESPAFYVEGQKRPDLFILTAFQIMLLVYNGLCITY